MLRTRVGYTGGENPKPSYFSVCQGDGHTEAIRIEYDPRKLKYTRLLKVFWEAHGSDVPETSPQYKSAIWYHTEEQRVAAEAACEWRKARGAEVVEVLAAAPWYDAEFSHQKYFVSRIIGLFLVLLVCFIILWAGS